MPRRSVITGQISHYPLRTRQTDVVLSHEAVAGQLTAIAIEAVAGDKFVFDILEPIMVVEFRVQITVTINYDTPTTLAVVALDRRITYNSDTGRAQLATVTIPNNAPAGEQIYKELAQPVNLERGDQLVVEVTTAGTGGVAIAGDWRPVILLWSIDFEDLTPKASDSAMTASV
jgi:hypothetical protein